MSLGSDAMLEKLRNRFRDRLAQELLLLRMRQHLVTQTPTHNVKQDLIRLAHGLAGSGGTFGFPEISAAAMTLEDCLRRNDNTQTIAAALDELISAVADAIPKESRA